MVTLQDMALHGSPWRVTVDLSGTSPQDIVIPKPARAITNPHQQYPTHESVTILGWAFDALGSTTPTFSIVSLDYAISEGTSVADPIMSYAWADGARSRDSVTPVYINLRQASYVPTPADPATLRITNSGIASGTLCIWGIFGSSDAQSVYSVTGSPVDRSSLT